MKKYALTGSKFEGEIIFGYNQLGYLVFFRMPEDMEEAMTRGLLTVLPKTNTRLQEMITDKDVTIMEIPEVISFEVFWEAYDKKINKKRSEPLFNKLSDVNQLKAINAIPAYKKCCERTNRGVADPEKYLRCHYFETDWTKQR